MSDYPLIFDIARGSYVDGPGIRSVVFFKGCPLRCHWCQNPESQSPEVETMFFPERCIHCGNCEKGCDSLARRTVGRYYSPSELSDILLRDKVYYDTSGGGVTFSGGEPLLYPEYLSEVIKTLKPAGIHITIETCGYFDFQRFEDTYLPFVDLILYDLKLIDAVKHTQHTGKSNELIIENFHKLLHTKIEVIPRTPLIPNYTVTEENLVQLAGLFNQLNIRHYHLLPYNPSGLEKWSRLGKSVPDNISAKPMSMKEEKRWSRFFEKLMGKTGEDS